MLALHVACFKIRIIFMSWFLLNIKNDFRIFEKGIFVHNTDVLVIFSSLCGVDPVGVRDGGMVEILFVFRFEPLFFCFGALQSAFGQDFGEVEALVLEIGSAA